MAGVANLLGGAKAAVPVPVKQEVVRMPDRQDPVAQAEAERKRRKTQEEAGGGRDQTILTSGDPPSYSNSELGK